MPARQLSLFEGKRQRGVAAPPPKEFATHCALADLLRRWTMPDRHRDVPDRGRPRLSLHLVIRRCGRDLEGLGRAAVRNSCAVN